METEKQFLTAKEAAAELGIQLATLYAYTSRGLIHSEQVGGKTRARRYRRDDVAALKQRKALRQNPAQASEQLLSWGMPIMSSAITSIHHGRLAYRGHDVPPLPDAYTFCDVANLLWTGTLTSGAGLAQPDSGQAALAAALRPWLDDLLPVPRCQLLLPLAAARDLAAYDLTPTAVQESGQRILRLMVTAVTGQVAGDNVAEALQRCWVPNEEAVRPLLNAALIYCADHELNASAFAARVAASAKANPYAAVMAGLATLQGSLHGGATERVDAFFQEVGQPEQAAAAVASRLRRGDALPGFGHPLYPEGDPRARALWARLTAVYPNRPGMVLAQQIQTAVETAVGLLPNIDFALVALAWAAKLPYGAALALFAIGRTAGWIGHILEQYGREQLIRPRARYVGL